jgi:hypothetical protein
MLLTGEGMKENRGRYIHNEQGEEPIITDETMNFVLFFFLSLFRLLWFSFLY